MAPSREDELIDWLRRQAPGGERLGDDSARLDPGGPLAVSTDQQIEGTHFPTGLDPTWLARRLLEVSISDLAATGATPRWALSTIAAPADWEHRRFLRALTDACRRHRIALAGGDIGRAPTVVLTLTVLGGAPRRPGTNSRAAARPKDLLWIGGPLGAAALGRRLIELGARPSGRSIRLPGDLGERPALARAARRAVRALLAPRAQLELGAELARRRRAAVIDVSDGLSLDLARLCRASGVGARLDRAAVPTDPTLVPLARHLDFDLDRAALGGGEDYVLLFSLPPSSRRPEHPGCVPIGRMTAGRALRCAETGEILEPTGWSHLDPASGEGRSEDRA